MSSILVIGDLVLDVFVRYDPQSGEADAGPDGVRLRPGGSAANFAVHAARAGADVRFVGRVGHDLEGEMLVRSLAEAGVTPLVHTSHDTPTGRVLVMVDSRGERRMWSYPGASATLDRSDFDSDTQWLSGLDALHMTGYSLLRDGPRDAALHALGLARGKGVRLCTLDPNPPHLIVDFGAARFRDMLKELRFDIIFPNLEEGMLLTAEVRPEKIATGLLEVARTVVLTLGERGCIVATGETLLHIEAASVEAVVDVTGAGDAFAASFVVEYLSTGDLQASALAANRFAALVVSRMGAR